MNFSGCAVFFIFFIFKIDSEASPQITKFAPVEDWIAFKRRTSDIKPLDKFLGKLRATYDFVFHKPENVSDLAKILPSDEPRVPYTEPYKFILSNSQENSENKKVATDSPVYVELLADEMSRTESSISRVSTDWEDEGVVEPLSELELLSDNEDNIDGSVERVYPRPSFQLPTAIATAFFRWLSSIIGFIRGRF